MRPTRRLVAATLALAFGCNDRFEFDNHTLGDNTAGAADVAEGGATAQVATGGRSESEGAGRGGTLAEECGGTHGIATGGSAGEAGAPGATPSDLDCDGPDAGCTRCRTHAECGYERLCDPVLLVCVQCRSDLDCPPHYTCSAVTHRCE